MRIAILEDETPLAEQMMRALEGAGYATEWCATGKALLARLKRETFDLLILDWNLPDMSGMEVLRWARGHVEGTLPVLFATSRGEERDIVAALDAGADDYVVKPIQTGELLARVAALLRRSYPATTRETETFGHLAFDKASTSVTVEGERLTLTPKEFDLALLLFRNQDRALSRSYMMETVWGHDPDVVTRTLDVHVSRIRDKLKLRPAAGFRLVPVYSYGYRLERMQPQQAQ